MKLKPAGRRHGVLACVLTALATQCASAAVYTIVDETYDPPLLALGGWEAGAANVERNYVTTGVRGSTAIQMSAELVDPSGYVATTVYQCGVMGGNDWATRDNTVLSFDIKVDRPGMNNVTILLEGWAPYVWNYFSGAPDGVTASVGIIPLHHYQPGKFKTIVVPLDSPLWTQNPYPDPNNMLPLFDPSSKTFNQVAVQVDADSLPALGSFSVVIDNVRVTTCCPHARVWEGCSSSTVTYVDGVPTRIDETGWANLLGHYTSTMMFDPSGPATVEIAVGSDRIFGKAFISGSEYGVFFEGGTGRFAGITGSVRGFYEWTDTTYTAFKSQVEGAVSIVGCRHGCGWHPGWRFGCHE